MKKIYVALFLLFSCGSIYAQDISNNLVGKFTFDTSPDDDLGLLGSSIVQGANLTIDRNSRPDSAYSFDGVDDYIEVADNDLLDFGETGDFSAALWFKSSGSTDNQIFMHKGTSTSAITLRMINSGTLMFSIRVGTLNETLETTQTYDDGQWHHAAFTLDRDGKQRIYVDGVQVAERNYTGSGTLTNSSVMRFGTFSTSVTQLLNGSLDDIYIYSRALAARDVQELAEVEPDISTDLIAKYEFSGNTDDGAGNLAAGSVVGATLASDRNDQANSAYSFDGVDDYIEVADNDLLDFGSEQAFTISLWFKADPHDDNRILVHKGNSTSGITTRILQDGTLSFFIRLGSANEVLTTDARYDDGLWHHVSFVLNRGNYQKIFVDGVETATRAFTSTGSLTNTSEMRFGTFAGNASQYMLGRIDDIYIHGRALSPLDIDELARTAPRLNDGLVGKFTFAGNANDATGKLGTSTVQGPTLTTDRDGLTDKAYSFDGVDDYIEVPDNDLLDFGDTGSFTITLWFKTESHTDNQIFLHKGNATSGITTRMLSDGTVSFFVRLGDQNDVLTTSGTYDDGNWHHAVFMMERQFAGYQRIYIDGSLVASRNTTWSGTLTNEENMRFGTFSGSVTQVMKGDLDDIYIYNRLIRQQEIDVLADKVTNEPPTVEVTISDLTIDEDAVATTLVADLNQVFSDPEGREMTFEVESSEELLDARMDGSQVLVEPSPDYFGSSVVTIIASDDFLNSTSVDVSVEVSNVNDAPEFELSTSELTLAKNFITTETIQLTDLSPENETEAITYSLTPASVSFADVSIDAATGNIDVVAVTDAAGAQQFTVTADDGQATATGSFTLTVLDNQPPTASNTIADQTFAEDAGVRVVADDLNAFFEDADGDALTFTASSDNTNIMVSVDAAQLSVEAAENYFGTGVITVTATDGEASVEVSFTVEVTSVNDAPVLTSAIADQTTQEDELYEFQVPSGTFTDVDNANLEVTASNLPSWLTFDASSLQFSGTPTNSDVGTYTITIVATDGEFTAEDQFDLTIENVNDKPVVVSPIGPLNFAEDSDELTFDLTEVFADVDNAALTYSIQQGVDNLLSASIESGILSLIPVANANGDGAITVRASDGALFADHQFFFEISPVNDAPEFTLGTTELVLDAGFEPQTIDIIPAEVPVDEQGEDVVYTVTPTVSFAEITIDNASGLITIAGIDDIFGSELVTVTANDGNTENNTASASFTLQVNQVLSTSPTKDQITIYPNPAVDFLKVESKTTIESLKVIDMEGRTIPVKRIGNTLDVSTLKPGAYLLEIAKEKRKTVKRFSIR